MREGVISWIDFPVPVAMQNETPAIEKAFWIRSMLVLGCHDNHILIARLQNKISNRSRKARRKITCGYILFKAYSERRS